MIMQDNEKKPALRFKGFTDPWEQRKLGEMVDVCSGMDYKHLSEGDIPVYGTGGYMLSVNKALSYDRNAVGIGRKGTIDKPYILKAPFWTVDTLFYAIPKDSKNIDFTFDVFQKVDWKKKDESTGVPSLSKIAINETSISTPSKLEQERIGSFFRNLDTLITLHQRKYEKLVNIKKSMLDKMFPQNGASVPEIRFKGFTDPWEQRKLAELTKTITTGKSVNSDEGEVSDGDIGVLKTSCVSYDRFNPSESKPVVKSEQQLVKCAVEKDSVIVSRMNTPERVGACGYVSTDFPNLFLPDRLWKLKFQDTVDTYFVYMMLVSSAYKEKITSMASGTSGSMYNIPKETFLNLQLVIPAKIDEQKQLGKILKKIDTLITLHQRKLEKLQNIKKSCLEKMFV